MIWLWMALALAKDEIDCSAEDPDVYGVIPASPFGTPATTAQIPEGAVIRLETNGSPNLAVLELTAADDPTPLPVDTISFGASEVVDDRSAFLDLIPDVPLVSGTDYHLKAGDFEVDLTVGGELEKGSYDGAGLQVESARVVKTLSDPCSPYEGGEKYGHIRVGMFGADELVETDVLVVAEGSYSAARGISMDHPDYNDAGVDLPFEEVPGEHCLDAWILHLDRSETDLGEVCVDKLERRCSTVPGVVGLGTSFIVLLACARRQTS